MQPVLNRIRSATAPAYLFLCLILGGSAQGVWQNALLQLLGVAIIAWAAIARVQEPLALPARQLLLIGLAAIAVVTVQLVPVPASIWVSGARAPLAAGMGLLTGARPAMPLSVAPFATVSALLALIPAIAMFCATAALGAYRPRLLAAALLAGAILGILLGALQVASSDPAQSAWYLYPDTNLGSAVGFFANSNHMATLLVACLPFLAALLAAGRTARLQQYSGLVGMVAGGVIVVVVGIALNQSMAGYGLALPVAAASVLIVLPRGSRARRLVAVAAAALLIAVVGALQASSIGGTAIGEQAATSVQSRQEILATSARAIGDFMPFGSGLGTFVKVYPTYEPIERVSPTYVIHAHNDYVELILELGVFGILLIGAFLIWWGAAVWRVWRTAEAGPFARAASVASAAILAHSLVDFPLRTAAVSAVFAMCMALLAGNRAAAAKDESDLRPTRHLVLG